MKNTVARTARRSHQTLKIFIVCFLIYFVCNVNMK